MQPERAVCCSTVFGPTCRSSYHGCLTQRSVRFDRRRPALHDVEVVIDEKHLRWAGGILFVDFDERVDAALIVRLGEVPVEVILPEDTRIPSCVRMNA